MEKDRVLVVEDEKLIRHFIEVTLRNVCEVTAVSDGRAGLAALEATPKAFSVVLTDVDMPLMSGIEMLRIARERDILGEAKIIVMSGRLNFATIEQELGSDFGATFLEKPFSPKNDLLPLVKK